MTSSGWILLGVVAAFWVPFAVRLRRKSLFPVVPVVPAGAVIAGFLLNRWIDWVGTVSVAVVHAALVAVVAIGNRKDLFGAKPDKCDDPD